MFSLNADARTQVAGSRAGLKNKSLRKYSVIVQNQGKPERKATVWFDSSLRKPWSADVACLVPYLYPTDLGPLL